MEVNFGLTSRLNLSQSSSSSSVVLHLKQGSKSQSKTNLKWKAKEIKVEEMSFAAAADATNISARKKKALDFVNKVKQESEMRNKETKVKKEEPRAHGPV